MDHSPPPDRDRSPWSERAAAVFCAAAAAAALWLLGKTLFGILAPFAAAALIAAAVTPLSDKICARTRISRGLCRAVLVFVLLAVLTLLLSLGIRRLITELGELAQKLAAGDAVSGLIDGAAAFLTSPGKAGPAFRILEKLNLSAEEVLRRAAEEIVAAVSAALPGLVSAIIGSLPGLLLGLAVTVISSFHFALDGERVRNALASLLPAGARRMLPHVKKEAAQTAGRYLRAYSLILLLTFAELFFGLSVIGIRYSFVIALVTALVDVLPVLGAGTVLLPWALVRFAAGDSRTGIGLVVLYAVIVTVRQFSEPRILGGSLGIHPLLTLFSMYAGFRLFGIVGMLAGPLVIAAVRALRGPVLPPAGKA